MSIITWDETGKKRYESGLDRGVLFPLKNGKYSTGVAWNGLISINEASNGAEATPLYADNIKYLNLLSAEEFGATIESYSYPEEFKPCMGEATLTKGVTIGQQNRQHFGLCYRTKYGNDLTGIDYGYKIHLIFDCIAAPTDKSYSTVNDSPDAITLSWEVSTIPINIEGYKPTSSLILDSTAFREAGQTNVLISIENILYGTENGANAKMPKISEILELFETEIYISDSESDFLLDGSGERIQSRVF